MTADIRTDALHEFDVDVAKEADDYGLTLRARLTDRGSWQLIEAAPDGEAWQHITHPRLRVIWSIARVYDRDSVGATWLHVSASLPMREPSHNEMALVKETFLGDRYAYAVWPPRDRYVNLNATVLHLWARLDGYPVLPEFSGTVNGVRTI